MSARISIASLFGLRALERGQTPAYVEWATSMLEAGHDSKHLRILAGLDASNSLFETEAYFAKALFELGIEEPDRHNALKEYSIHLAESILDHSLSHRRAVHMLSEIYQLEYFPDYLAEWYKLEDALTDLDYGESPWSYSGLTRKNAVEIIEKETKKFLNAQKGREVYPLPKSGWRKYLP